ncbi:flavodoxin [Vibrio porteresiae]|uniref:Flavodoxin n=1 Tax=Vibrio porteresiae DSM 19223 TaxID=1123496 RepID=A0ABZ0QIA9_9VIBR|nr:flavodoxin [Vibrio porteresiae]WPC76224.1 flavodoxin [Vibrio porteresiae DSM 19223]
MAQVGIFFGTDTGSTRKIAKQIQKELGDLADKPKNINRTTVDEILAYDFLIFGTPTLGEGKLPGKACDCEEESWDEFVPNFNEMDLSGKTVALFGLGDQVGYANEFVDGLGELYDYVANTGAAVVGFWPLEGYDFVSSNAVDGDEFVGLVIDKDNQASLTDQRVSGWVEQIKAEMGL